MNGKELTINDIMEEMDSLKERYYYIASLLEKNFMSIQLRGVAIKDIMVDGGLRNPDKILVALAKNEDLSVELENTKKSYYSYKDLLIDKIHEMKKEKSASEMIVFYRDIMGYKFEDISVLVNYSKRQVIRKYKKAKNVTQCH